jgi:hypothetical protein
VRLAWPELLDALEERTRRCAALVEHGADLVGEDLALSADGPLPPELALRARVLLAETERVQQLAGRRAVEMRTALHYGRD